MVLLIALLLAAWGQSPGPASALAWSAGQIAQDRKAAPDGEAGEE
jgi:hypothetical protein